MAMDHMDVNDASSVRMQGSGPWTQFGLLMRKNWLLACRVKRSTAGQLFTPLAIALLLVAFQVLADYVLSQEGAHV